MPRNDQDIALALGSVWSFSRGGKGKLSMGPTPPETSRAAESHDQQWAGVGVALLFTLGPRFITVIVAIESR